MGKLEQMYYMRSAHLPPNCVPSEDPEGTPFTKAGGDAFVREPPCSLCWLFSVGQK